MSRAQKGVVVGEDADIDSQGALHPIVRLFIGIGVIAAIFTGYLIYDRMQYSETCIESKTEPDEIIGYDADNFTIAKEYINEQGHMIRVLRHEPIYNYSTLCTRYALTREA